MADWDAPPGPPPSDISSWFLEEGNVPAGAVRAGAPGYAGPGVLPEQAPGSRAGGFVLLPPTFLRPDRAQDFHVSGASAIGAPFANANTNPPEGILIPGATFTLPDANMGVIRSINLNVNTLLATSRIFWTLRFDGSPVPGWNSLTVFPRAVGSFSLAFGPEETQIPVPEGATITMSIVVLDGGTYQAGADFGGWFYDRAIADAFASAWRL